MFSSMRSVEREIMRGEWVLTPSIDMSSCHDNKSLILIMYAHPMISDVSCYTGQVLCDLRS